MSGRARARGLSLLEVIVASGLLASLVSLGFDLLARTQAQVGEGLGRSAVDAQANRLGRLVAGELRNAAAHTLVLNAPAPTTGALTSVRFRPGAGFDAATGLPRLGPVRLIRFELAAGESFNGVDDDGDRLVDEGSLVLYRDDDGDGTIQSDERLVVLAHDVAGSTLTFELPGASRASGGSGQGLDPDLGAGSGTAGAGVSGAGARSINVGFDLQRREGAERVSFHGRALRVALRN